MNLGNVVSIVANLPSIVALIQLGIDKFSALAEVVVEEMAEAEAAYEAGETKLQKVLAVVESFTEDWDENWDDLVESVTALIETIVDLANTFDVDISSLSDLVGDDETEE